MKITSLQNRIRTISVELPDELGTLQVTYRAVNGPVQDKLGETAKEYQGGNQVDRVAADLAQLVTGWDAVDDSGPVAPSFEVLRTFDIAILGAISAAITEAQFPPKKAGSPSGASS